MPCDIPMKYLLTYNIILYHSIEDNFKNELKKYMLFGMYFHPYY